MRILYAKKLVLYDELMSLLPHLEEEVFDAVGPYRTSEGPSSCLPLAPLVTVAYGGSSSPLVMNKVFLVMLSFFPSLSVTIVKASNEAAVLVVDVGTRESHSPVVDPRLNLVQHAT